MLPCCAVDSATTRGNDFFRTLIIKEQSRVVGLENARKMLELIERGDNVVILSNHQTEADPQVHRLPDGSAHVP